ncbi:MAG: phosphoribosyltransferase [Burkholderiales bacterium]|nr:phosphoribosyltransferase [Burkholderiales bacterium]
MKDLHVSWQTYGELLETLAEIVYKSGWKFDSLLCLSRGGLRPGDVLSRIYDIPLSILAASSYRDAAGTIQGKLNIGQYIASSRPNSVKGKVLVVDDLVDSGLTMKKVIEHIRDKIPNVTEVKLAVIWWKKTSIVIPDFYVQYLADSPWIHQPFEEYDAMSISELLDRTKNYDLIIRAPETVTENE